MSGLAKKLTRPVARKLPRSMVEGVGASAYAPYPAPSGFYWDFVTYLGDRVTYMGQPVVSLVRIA